MSIGLRNIKENKRRIIAQSRIDEALKGDKQGQYIDTSLCGNGTWAAIDFLKPHHPKKFKLK